MKDIIIPIIEIAAGVGIPAIAFIWAISHRIAKLEYKVDGMERRFDSIDARLDRIDATLQNINAELSAMREFRYYTDKRIDYLEHKEPRA